MDRLLCGDVGYGKTEVAMRAAFKSVMEGKQAVILTPTTVLAYQHYDTFRTRFAPFPVKVELLSRFRSAKEQKEVVKRVESGEVDVVIGTHRLLSKDVQFKDLGLVVVDEEQRFGVAHKERLKHLEETRRCADAIGNADSAYAQHVAQWHARHVVDRNSAARSSGDSNSGRPVFR